LAKVISTIFYQKEKILSKVKENIDWDLEAQNMVDFIEKE
jgi:hypothetical protein